MILLFAIFILSAASPGGGTSIKLFEDDVETSYLDIEKNDRSGQDRIVWVTHDYRTERRDGMKYARDQWSIGCGRRTFSILAIVEHSADGRVLSAKAVPLDERRPIPIPSGGRMEAVFDAVCR